MGVCGAIIQGPPIVLSSVGEHEGKVCAGLDRRAFDQHRDLGSGCWDVLT